MATSNDVWDMMSGGGAPSAPQGPAPQVSSPFGPPPSQQSPAAFGAPGAQFSPEGLTGGFSFPDTASYDGDSDADLGEPGTTADGDTSPLVRDDGVRGKVAGILGNRKARFALVAAAVALVAGAASMTFLDGDEAAAGDLVADPASSEQADDSDLLGEGTSVEVPAADTDPTEDAADPEITEGATETESADPDSDLVGGGVVPETDSDIAPAGSENIENEDQAREAAEKAIAEAEAEAERVRAEREAKAAAEEEAAAAAEQASTDATERAARQAEEEAARARAEAEERAQAESRNSPAPQPAPAPVRRPEVSTSVVCTTPAQITFTATGRGAVTLDAGGSTATGSGSATKQVSVAAGEPVRAVATADNHVQIRWEARGTCR